MEIYSISQFLTAAWLCSRDFIFCHFSVRSWLNISLPSQILHSLLYFHIPVTIMARTPWPVKASSIRAEWELQSTLLMAIPAA